MDDLLKDAIADAKAVRETALANAKLALEEAFTPRIQSMLSQKIQSEIEDEDEGMHGDADEGEDQDEESHADGEPHDEDGIVQINTDQRDSGQFIEGLTLKTEKESVGILVLSACTIMYLAFLLIL